MSVMMSKQQKDDLRRRQAQGRRERNRAHKESRAQTATPKESVEQQPALPAPPALLASPAPVVPTDPKRDAQWQGCCKVLFNQRHQPNDLEQLQAELLKQVDQPLLSAALELVAGMAAAGVRRWDWLPAPTDDELADPKAWVAQQLADRSPRSRTGPRTPAACGRRWRERSDNRRPDGTGTPSYLQQSKYSLEQLGQRLEWTKDAHEAAGREFRRELLDHRSPHFIKVLKVASATSRSSSWRADHRPASAAFLR